MLWVLLTFGSALLLSIVAVLRKKVLGKEHALQFLMTSSFASGMIMLLFYPKVDFIMPYGIFMLLYVKSVILALSYVLLFKAYRHMEISSVEPLRNLSPIFLVVLAFIFLGEKLTIMNLLGVVILIAGAYIVQVDHSWTHVIENLKIFKNKHIEKILISLVLISFCALIDKIVIAKISVFTVIFFTFWLMFLNTFIVFSNKYNGYRGLLRTIHKENIWLAVIALIQIGADILYFYAISLPGVMVALVVPLKRMSTLFATIIGGEIFHDHGLKTRAVGCVVAIFGVALVIL